MNRNNKAVLASGEDKSVVTYRVVWVLLDVAWREQEDRGESKLSVVIRHKDDGSTAPSANNNPPREEQSMVDCLRAEATSVVNLRICSIWTGTRYVVGTQWMASE